MQTPPKTYQVETNYNGLNRILFGTLEEIKRKEIDLETATVISQIADKIIKNNLTAILDKKRRTDDSPIPYFDNVEDRILIQKTK